MKECVQFYINGEWVDPVNPQHLDVINPATEESIAKIAMGNSEDVNKAVAAAKNAFDSFSQTSKEERLALMGKILEVYQSRYDEIAIDELSSYTSAEASGKKCNLVKYVELGSNLDFLSDGIPRASFIASSVIPVSACTHELADWLELLGPWGSEMEEPKFIIPNAKISSLRRFGFNNEHASFYINDGSSKKLKVKKFNLLNSSLDKVLYDFENKNFNFLGSLIIDTWNNSKSVELMLDDIICSDEA